MPADKHSFHVTLSSGAERDIKGDDAAIDPSGALVITAASGDAVAMYSPTAWVLCEPEKRDDTGE